MIHPERNSYILTDTFLKDSRLHINALYETYQTLGNTAGFTTHRIFNVSFLDFFGNTREYPVLSIVNNKKGPSLWVITGIHGEEPAGVNAVAQNLDIFQKLHNDEIPLVIFPLCNPKGYALDWRYPNSRRGSLFAVSVGDSDHYLPHKNKLDRPMRYKAKRAYNQKFTSHVLELTVHHPPRIVIDLHEDEDQKKPEVYIYSHGISRFQDEIAQAIVRILIDNDIPLKKNGTTRFGEEVYNGVVSASDDGSIDHFLSSKRIFINGVSQRGPGAHSVIVVETPTVRVPLKKRVAIHSEVIQSLGEFWRLIHTKHGHRFA